GVEDEDQLAVPAQKYAFVARKIEQLTFDEAEIEEIDLLRIFDFVHVDQLRGDHVFERARGGDRRKSADRIFIFVLNFRRRGPAFRERARLHAPRHRREERVGRFERVFHGHSFGEIAEQRKTFEQKYIRRAQQRRCTPRRVRERRISARQSLGQ